MTDDLTRYFVVDRLGRPTAQYPTKGLNRATVECKRLNGPTTNDTLGVRQGRPYRVVKLVPAPPAPEATE